MPPSSGDCLRNLHPSAIERITDAGVAFPCKAGRADIIGYRLAMELSLVDRWLCGAEVALRTLLMVRSGVDPVAAKALGAWDALHNAADRDMLLRRLKNQDVYLSAAAN